jgi:gas vesicle protein
MNTNGQFFDEYNDSMEPIPPVVHSDDYVEPAITVQAEDALDETQGEAGAGSIAAGVAGAAIGSVIGGRIAGRKGAVIGAVAGAVAGGLAAKATPDDAGEKLKNVTENAAEKVKDAAEHAKPSLESAADKVKDAALNTADRVQEAAENAKPSIENAADKAKEAASNTADKVKDTAEQVKPSDNIQDLHSADVKERIVIEPTADVVTEPTFVAGTGNYLGSEVAPMDLYQEEEIATPEVERQNIFTRETDQRF